MEKTEMKRTFLKMLPFAAALLLATSCCKDDNNSVDEIVNNGGEQIETVNKTFKTLTVKGKVNKSISKVTTNTEGTVLAFEGGEKFTFGNSNTDDVYGTITIEDAVGNYTATINYIDEIAITGSYRVATLGTNSKTISEAYGSLADAVKNAYYRIDFYILQQEDGTYELIDGNSSSDIVVNLQSAFIKALSAESILLDRETIEVEADKYYVVPEGKYMGTNNFTIAGKIYSVGKKTFAFSVSPTKKVVFSSGNLQYNRTTNTYQFAENQLQYLGKKGTEADVIDLFGWGTGNNPTEVPTITMDSPFIDWGSKISDGYNWYTLSADEWGYLCGNTTFPDFPKRDNALSLRKLIYCMDKHILVILPDECPADVVSFLADLDPVNWLDQLYPYHLNPTDPLLDLVSTLEAAGAVLLVRYPESLRFWTSTDYIFGASRNVYYFGEGYEMPLGVAGYNAVEYVDYVEYYPVRLVRSLE